MRRCRALFLSDVHLGRADARPAELVEFLRGIDAQTIYLVGDLFDRLRPGDRAEIPVEQRAVVAELRRRARDGVRMVYVPGNHDSRLRARPGRRAAFPDVIVALEACHVTADGRRFLVVHGDRQEPPGVRRNPCLRVAVRAHNLLERASRALSRLPGLRGRSLARLGKDLVLYRMGPGKAFRDALAGMARARGYDGVVAGHIHHPHIARVGGVLVANCGDWLTSCTAVLETADGRLELVTWRG